MREIKFRGRKPNGEWVYGDLVTVETTDGQPSKYNIRPYDVDLECPEDKQYDFDISEELLVGLFAMYKEHCKRVDEYIEGNRNTRGYGRDKD